MDSDNNEINKKAKNVGKSILKRIVKSRIVIGIVVILLVILILSVSYYTMKQKEFEDSKNAGREYVSNSKADVNNGIVTTYEDEETGEEVEYSDEKIRELFEKYGYNVERYFSGEEGIKKLEYILNAEVVTQFPYIEGLSADKVNGVVKFKRLTDEYYDEEQTQEEQYLKYTTSEKLNAWIEEYNADNSMTESKQEALMHFTMDDEQNIIVAYLEEVEVVTNDEEKPIEEIKDNLSLKYQDIGYTTSVNNGIITYNFQRLHTEKVSYIDMIQDYIMPTELLFAFLTYGEDLEFVLNLAKLAYESTIVMGIHDEFASTNVKEYTYNKQIPIIDTAVARITSDYDLNGVLYTTDDLEVTQSGNTWRVSRDNKIENIYLDDYGQEVEVYEVNGEIIGILNENNELIPVKLMERYINYYTYSNLPTIDLYVADVWYAYYNNIIDYGPDIKSQVTESKVANGTYKLIETIQNMQYSSTLDDELVEDVNNLLESFANTDEFKIKFKEKFDESFDSKIITQFKFDFSSDFNKQYKKENSEKYDETGQILAGYAQEYQNAYSEAYNEYYRENFLKFANEFYESNYESDFERSFNIAKSTLKANSNTTVTRKKYICDANIKKVEYNINTQTYNAESISTENNYFVTILSNSSRAKGILASSGEWLIEQLEKTEETIGIVDRVKYLLNEAYSTKKYGELTAEDMGLYTTNSINVNLKPSNNFTEIAKACHDYLRLNNYYYSSESNKAAGNYVKDGTSTGGQVQIVYGAPQSERYTDCSAYVTWVLMQTGHLSSDLQSQWNSTKLFNDGDSIDGISSRSFASKDDMINFFENQADIAQFGYIIVKKGHTEIYAGKDDDGYYYTYNAGSTSSIRKEDSKYTKNKFFTHFDSSEYKVLIVGGI